MSSTTGKSSDGIRLQILISTMGADGLRRIAALPHPRVDGVEYIVSWQAPDPKAIPAELLSREDFRIFPTGSKGLGANRQDALSHATAPYILISDDDLSYDGKDLTEVIESLDAHPDYAYLTFRYESPDAPRVYPEHEFDMTDKPKGYFVTSFEIAVNRRRILQEGNGASELRFNPRFGIGSEFCAGEEDMMLADLDKAGFKGRFIPRRVAVHTGPTTGMRREYEHDFIECKGAVIGYSFPLTWPLRMLTHAWRARRHTGFLFYCRCWLSGFRRFRQPQKKEDIDNG